MAAFGRRVLRRLETQWNVVTVPSCHGRAGLVLSQSRVWQSFSSRAATTDALKPSFPEVTDVETASSSSVALPLQRSRGEDIIIKGPIADDMEGGARHATTVTKMWSNIPVHVRASFTAPNSLEEVPENAAPPMLGGVFGQAKALAARAGLAPARWSVDISAPYYNGEIPLAPFRRGQTAAYNYPRILVPREMALRVPSDMYVDPVFQTSDPEQKWKMRSTCLFPRMQNKTTLLLIFSGQPLSGLFTGLQRWLDSTGKEFLGLPKTQLLKMHCSEGWLNRRTHQLTKFHLRRQVPEDELFTTLVYRGKWKWEYVRALHLYDKNLPVVLLIDPLGYIRWHAVGLPTDDATEVFKQLSRRLAVEKRSHS